MSKNISQFHGLRGSSTEKDDQFSSSFTNP